MCAFCGVILLVVCKRCVNFAQDKGVELRESWWRAIFRQCLEGALWAFFCICFLISSRSLLCSIQLDGFQVPGNLFYACSLVVEMMQIPMPIDQQHFKDLHTKTCKVPFGRHAHGNILLVVRACHCFLSRRLASCLLGLEYLHREAQMHCAPWPQPVGMRLTPFLTVELPEDIKEPNLMIRHDDDFTKPEVVLIGVAWHFVQGIPTVFAVGHSEADHGGR